jgi:riboflavin kinase/FMN adenylyltransferase
MKLGETHGQPGRRWRGDAIRGTEFTREQIDAAFAKYHGDFYQTPPMVSAIKKGGVPLYKLARKGQVVEREPRFVHVYAPRDPGGAPAEIDFPRGVFERLLRSHLCERHRRGTGLRRALAGPAPNQERQVYARACGQHRDFEERRVKAVIEKGAQSPAGLDLAGSLTVRILRATSELAQIDGPLHLAIGVFDGVHLGHQAVIRHAVDSAESNGGSAVIVTFDPHPASVLRPDQAPALLTSSRHKLRLIRALGVTHALVVPFDVAFASTAASRFHNLARVSMPAIKADLRRGELGVRTRTQR